MAGVLRKAIQAQAEQFRAALFEFVKTRVDLPVQSDEELVALLTPLRIAQADLPWSSQTQKKLP